MMMDTLSNNKIEYGWKSYARFWIRKCADVFVSFVFMFTYPGALYLINIYYNGLELAISYYGFEA